MSLMLLSIGVTNGIEGLRVGIKGTTAVTTGALVEAVVAGRDGTLGLVVTTTGGLRVGMRGLRVVVAGTLTGGVTFLVGGDLVVVVVGEIRLAVTGGLIVVVVLFWSESGILLPPLLLLWLGVVFPGRGGSITTFGIAKRRTNMLLSLIRS